MSRKVLQMDVKVEMDTWTVEPTAILSVTHNGGSWSTIRLESQDEVNQVIEALQKFSGLTKRAADKPSAPHAWSPCSQCGSMGYCTHRDPAYR
jgi:hypothetical protein